MNAALTTNPQSTYLGGTGIDAQFTASLAIHQSGDVYVAGVTNSTDFPARIGGAQPAPGSIVDGFISRLTGDLAGGIVPPTATPTITPTTGGPIATATPTRTVTPTTVPPSPTVTSGGPGGGPSTPVPMLDPRMLSLLALTLAGIGYFVLKTRN